MDNAEFQRLRRQFTDDPFTKGYLPNFIRDNVDGDGVWEYLKDVHTGSGAYAARRKHIREQFQPLLNCLPEVGAPADASVSTTLAKYNAEGVSEVWHKALNRRTGDPEGAITSARTLLEEVCKHILEDAGIVGQEKWDLPKLHGEVAKVMNLAPSQHTEETFKRILGGCHSVVEGLGSLRNKISDAHGGGRRRVRPSERHASLAVNLAGSMSMFLIETWEIHQAKEAAKTARKEIKQKPITHRGVLLSSRHDLAEEILVMQRIVDALPADMARRIETIFCDSKACAVYSITVENGLWHPDLQWTINEVILATSGGHNGVYFDGDAPSGIDLDPDWLGDFEASGA